MGQSRFVGVRISARVGPYRVKLMRTKSSRTGEASGSAYGTLVRFFTGVPSHVHDQHVLSLEGFFLPRALLPAANKALLVGVYVIVVDMLHEIVLV